jgi:hypothetical protein
MDRASYFGTLTVPIRVLCFFVDSMNVALLNELGPVNN